MTTLFFLSQSLSNLGDDSALVWSNTKISVPSPREAQAFMTRVAAVTKDGHALKPSREDESVLVFRTDFVLQIDFPEKDSVGRISTVLCYGQIPAAADIEKWPRKVERGFASFAAKYERNMGDVQRQVINDACDQLLAYTTSDRGAGLKARVLGAGSTIRNVFHAPTEQRRDHRDMSNLPEEPSARRVILVLKKGEAVLLEAEQASRPLLIDQEIAILELPTEVGSSSLLSHLKSMGLLVPHTVLMQVPTDSEEYGLVTNAADTVLHYKLGHIMALLRELGARSTTIEHIERKTSERSSSWETSATGRLPSTGGKITTEVNVNSQDLMRLVRSLTLTHTFPPSPVNLPRAKELLTRTGLGHDPLIRDLLAARSGEYPASTWQLRISTETETTRARNVLARIKVPFAEVSNDVKTFIRESASYSLAMSASFEDH